MAQKSKFQEEVEDLNLIPIMNLVLCLIPAVLLKTQLVKMGILEAEPPQIASAPSPTPPDPNKKPLGLSITIEDTKLKITASDNQLEAHFTKPEVVIEFEQGASKGPGLRPYNYVDLYKKMAKIRSLFKEEHHKKEVLKIKASKEIPFRYVIRIMDVIRYRIASDQDISTLDKLSAAIKEKKFDKIEGTKSYVTLWYGISFDKPVESDPAAGSN